MAYGLARALERRVGARGLDLDCMAGTAGFAFVEAQQIDFALIADTFDSAGYTLKTIEATVQASVTREGEESFAILSPSGQRIALSSKAAAGPPEERILRIEAPFGSDNRPGLVEH